MGRAAASTWVRVLWAAVLMAVVGTLAVSTTAAAAAASSWGCHCPCGRGSSVGAAGDYVKLDGATGTKRRPMGATVTTASMDEGGNVGTMTFSQFVRLGRPQPLWAAWRMAARKGAPRGGGWREVGSWSVPSAGMDCVLNMDMLCLPLKSATR